MTAHSNWYRVSNPYTGTTAGYVNPATDTPRAARQAARKALTGAVNPPPGLTDAQRNRATDRARDLHASRRDDNRPLWHILTGNQSTATYRSVAYGTPDRHGRIEP